MASDLLISRVVLSHFSELIHQLNKGPLRVYACLARMSPNGEPIDISQRELARASNLSRSNVQIALAKLEEVGLLQILPGTRTMAARYQLLKPPDLVPDPLGRGPANQEVDLPTGPQQEQNRSTETPVQVHVLQETGPLKPLISLEKNGPSRAFQLTNSTTVVDTRELVELSALVKRFGFELNQHGLRKIAAAVRGCQCPLQLLEKFFLEKVKEKDSHYRLDDGLLVTWVRHDLERWLRRRKPPQRQAMPQTAQQLPARSREEEIERVQGLVELLPEHPDASLWHAELAALKTIMPPPREARDEART